MRLIDADALKLSMMLIAPGETKKYCYPCKEILKEIDDAPTIEECKRCKDCKHYKFWDKRCEWTGYEDVGEDDFCDDFCSRTERRTDGRYNQ